MAIESLFDPQAPSDWFQKGFKPSFKFQAVVPHAETTIARCFTVRNGNAQTKATGKSDSSSLPWPLHGRLEDKVYRVDPKFVSWPSILTGKSL
jgi:hypothetical protein